MPIHAITSPDDPRLGALCDALAQRAPGLDRSGDWPSEQLRLCGEYGVFRWFAGREWGGLAWSEEDLIRGYLALASACLTTTFVLTQRQGACRRIESSDNAALKERLLPGLTAGTAHATVGISHLTTSRRYEPKPVMRATERGKSFTLNGYSPWVTGAGHVDYIVLGATVVDRDDHATPEELIAVAPANTARGWAEAPAALVALTASRTGAFRCDELKISRDWLVAGPMENVMAAGSGGGTGGLQTSTLALGLSKAAIGMIAKEVVRRPELQEAYEALEAEYERLETALLSAVQGAPTCTNDDLRQSANNLVLRSTQAALTAAKGAGFVATHPAGRYCREAMFFLVWSCPQAVTSAHMCELAGIE